MGFLDRLCDYDAGEAEVSWSSFWRLENTCALTTLGAAVPFVISVLICLAVISLYRARSSISSSSNKMAGCYRQLNINDPSGETSSVVGGGNEESKDTRLHHEDSGFATSALEPLLGNHSNGDVVMVDSPESVVEAGTDCDGVGGRGTTPKKGTGVHWLKLLLYWSQAAFHLSVGCYDLFDGHTDDPYKYVCSFILAVAWTIHCITECVHHAITERRRNPPYQVIFSLVAFGAALWVMLRDDGFGGVRYTEAAAWDLGLLLVIVLVEIWSCVRIVPMKHYKFLTAEYAANIWSLYNFDWYTKVINEGYTKIFNLDELPELVDDDRAFNIWARYSKFIYPRGQKAVKDGEKLDVGGNIVRLGGKRYFLQAATALIGATMQLIPPLALNKITDFMENYDPDTSEGVPFVVVCAVAGLFISQAVSNYADATMFKLGRRMGIRSRSALVTAVFRKAMTIDMSSADAGQLQNNISVDAEAVLNLMVFQMFIWSAIIRLVSCVVLLFWVLGISAISGLSLIFLSLPVNKILVARLKNLQLKLMKRRDERMSVVSESMNGIRIIKLFAWEPNFLAKMVDARNVEMMLLRAYMLTLGAFMVVVKASPTLIGLFTFLVHTKVFNYELTAASGFTALALFNQLRMPLIVLPDTINYYIQARVSFKRIESFLSRTADDVGSNGVNGSTGSDRHCPDLAKGQLKIENGSFRWRQSPIYSTPTLRNINLNVEPNQLVCVYGPTGAGKSSLLMACLQELETIEGRSLMNGSVAYASQRAWIQNATVRDNILFGSPFDSRRYEQVLEACALKSDLEILEGGDQTEIGEKGVNLSGGQQQRVSLARAVYADTDILLLDDVLSAVDAHVGKHIFDKCIRKMLKKKTVVLVTHQVSMSAHYADKIVVLGSDGTIKEQGTYDELAADGEGHLIEAIEAGGGEGAKIVRQSSMSSAIEENKDPKEQDKPAVSKMIIEVEKRAVGRPKLSLFSTYFRYCGGVWFGVAWAVLSVAWQGLTVAQSFTLRKWINQMSVGNDMGSGFWLYVFISIAGFLTLLVRTLLITSGSLMASRRVHSAMSESVFGAPVSWYDSTPLGRIFNRFSSDIITLDKDLMNDIAAYTDLLLSVVGVVVVIALAIPLLTVAMVPIMALCFYYANRYIQTSRQLKRLEAVTRSPLYAHFSESVNGVATIRAFEAENRFITQNENHVNNLNRAHYTLWCSNYWLTNRVRLIGALVCFLVGIFLVASVSRIDGSTGGLVLTYALSFTISIVFTVRLHAQMEMSINSIERLDEYCKLEQEAPAIIDGRRPPDSWPSSGEVDIRDLTLKYKSSNEPVLHKVSFYVPPRTRVGIVGRTGAGKSSLMNALFRIVEPMYGSSIVVDGQDILKMGLRDLRRRLAIIPQDPTLFHGTIRSNVDPFNEYSDPEIWTALRQCRLHSYVSDQELKLKHEISAGGSNLSVGQRQLMCMARALLRRAAVLVMDEATANVDPETDALIQEAMKEGFGDCTILCIAHRLHTVAFYDRVLVLSKGEVMEYDTPLALLDNPNSEFKSMCEKTGDLEGLRRVAQESLNRSSPGTQVAAHYNRRHH